MIRAVITILTAVFLAAPALAQPFGALARLLPGETQLTSSEDRIDLTLGLSQAVPFRVFSLPDPWRVVVDFREVGFSGLDNAISPHGPVIDVSAGQATEAGWSRLILTLDRPFLPQIAAMETDPITAEASVFLSLSPVSATAFQEQSRPPQGLAAPTPTVAEARPDTGARLTVVLDPGHGGIDPGAVRGEVTEAGLVLGFARELREALRRTGRVDVVMTRDADIFVPLPTRVTLARAAGADAFLSIHADALAEGRARGATVYTLSETATDAAAAALAEQHDRADLLQGVDLQGTDDVIAGVLMDLARLEAAPQSAALADGIVEAIGRLGLELHRRPRGEAGFTVLRAADIPSVLIEVGFMSDERDLANIQDPDWRAEMQAALVQSVLDWADTETARRELLRQ